MDASLVLEDFIRILHIIYSLKSGSFWFSFEWCTMKKFSEVPPLSIGPFEEVQREVIYFPFAIRKNVSELSKDFSSHCKSRENSGPRNFLTPIKSSIPDVWNWNYCLVSKLKRDLGGMTFLLLPTPPRPPLRWLCPCTWTFHIIKPSKLQKHVFHHYKSWERKLVFVCFSKKLNHQNEN